MAASLTGQQRFDAVYQKRTATGLTPEKDLGSQAAPVS